MSHPVDPQGAPSNPTPPGQSAVAPQEAGAVLAAIHSLLSEIRGAVVRPEAKPGTVAAWLTVTSHPVDPSSPPLPASLPLSEAITVSAMCDRYLATAERRHARGKLSEKALTDYRRALAPFVAVFGTRAAALATEAGAEDVEDWLATTGWSPSTQNTYLGVVLGAFRLSGLKAHIKRPPKESRGADAYLDDDQFAELLAELRRRRRGGVGDIGDLIEALRLTGARPQELAQLTAADVGWETATIRLTEHKTKGSTGKDRIIYLTAAALAVLERRRPRRNDLLLFRTKTGTAYTTKVIVRALIAASKRLGFRAFAYACRHTFATSALTAGVPDALVAELLGHTGTGMLAHHYAHVNQHARELKAAAEQASGRKAV